MNKIFISGRWTKDHDIKYTQSGTAILSNTIASNRKFKNQNGEYESDFVNVIMFNQQAKYVADYSKKGDKVLIEGRLQVRNYENQEGKKVYITEVVADSVELLTPKQTTTNQFGNPVGTRQVEQDPFQQMANQIENEIGVDIDEDSLPF